MIASTVCFVCLLVIVWHCREQYEKAEGLRNKLQTVLTKVSEQLQHSSLFNASEKMSVASGVEKLVESYENIIIQRSEDKTTNQDMESKLSESQTKIKRLATTVKKLQNIRTQLQTRHDSEVEKGKNKQKLIDLYIKSLNTIESETKRSLDRWKVFVNEILKQASSPREPQQSSDQQQQQQAGNSPGVEHSYENEKTFCDRIVGDLRTLSMFFIQSLDTYRQKDEQFQSETTKLTSKIKDQSDELEKLQKSLSTATQRAESSTNSSSAKNIHIEKLTTKLNQVIDSTKTFWHYDLSKNDYIDLNVMHRIRLDNEIWCLVRWRTRIQENNLKLPSMVQKDEESKDSNENGENGSPRDGNVTPATPNGSVEAKKKKKYLDRFFWTKQDIYLGKLNVKEDEILMPDLFQNKLENQITKELESKWKAIQRRTDRQIQELVCY